MPDSGLDTAVEIGAESVASFERDGFVRLPAVLDAGTVTAYEPAITAKVIELNTMRLPMAERSTYDKAFLQVPNLWRENEAAKRFVFSRRLARIAADLLGVRGVRLYHDQALYKEPGGGITPWHADQYYWPVHGDRICTAWVPLQDTPMPMGPLSFARGSHRLDLGRHLEIGDESEAAIQLSLEKSGLETVTEPYVLGDVSYHLGWTFHRAAPNRSAAARRVMTIIYMDADITITEPVTAGQRADLGRWMAGASVGDVPETPTNPVLYRAPTA